MPAMCHYMTIGSLYTQQKRKPTLKFCDDWSNGVRDMGIFVFQHLLSKNLMFEIRNGPIINMFLWWKVLTVQNII